MNSNFAAALRTSLGGALLRPRPFDAREFLPAALEIVETPPSPTGRAFGFIIILLFLSMLVWSFLGQVDILATAPGRLAPAGEVKVIQPLNSGIVRAIHVQDGDHVRAGQPLIDLDPTEPGADRQRLGDELVQAQFDVARLSALRLAVEHQQPPRFVAPPGVPAARAEEASAAMTAQADGQAAKLADLSQQISAKDAEIAEAKAEAEKFRAQLPMLTEKASLHQKLLDRGYGSKLASLDAEQQLTEARHELAIDNQKAAQAFAARKAIERERDGARSQYVADLLSDLRKAEDQVGELRQELVKAQDKFSQTELRSPIDGVVDQLAIHTLRGVVTPAERLMIVVPENRNLTVEAQLANRDVGFVHPGQAVKVKIETFDFTRYGLIEGTVVGVSRDSMPADDTRRLAGPSNAQEPGPSSGSPNYVARIALKQSGMTIDGDLEPLRSGMSVTAEIRTGRRRIIGYLLSPLMRRKNESLHER